MEYLKGEWQKKTFLLGIDFTDSNGDTNEYDSLISIKELGRSQKHLTKTTFPYIWIWTSAIVSRNQRRS
ncbi:UNKNOWN [Stylonychia lemnae]|uniref:Uncharacterized protein n=1 Tax=Stylonychia lemnae TaxID=5949 RepID=A0A078AM43_STYLE|nr:UNKNOWN [Stylonychia lemnae]|eukprot:CDW83445.1 UNKNOWN [Stylonychia lemnae]